ncbi:hypothetical protein K3M67_03085 [Sphingobium sp. V4]|uniref:hypothetical protein n=1 Tax=Sphingobium sp. V4 TaxID=3038927 RepID=UPI002557E411|nr:hypothetical protein [Sphingobium sp. V4]WIW88981.1 hypothetical protein K3M67_03085 [Sphingobium sp. V4]
MTGWKPGVIMIATEHGRTPLPGWISEPFGLDWGIDSETRLPVWIVHHLPTGYNLMAVDHGIADVVQLVDLLRSLGDWSFTDMGRVEDFADTLAVVRASGFTVFSPRIRVGRPTMPNELPQVAA